MRAERDVIETLPLTAEAAWGQFGIDLPDMLYAEVVRRARAEAEREEAERAERERAAAEAARAAARAAEEAARRSARYLYD